MTRKSTFSLLTLSVVTAAVIFAQDINIWISGAGGKPALAVIDFRGSGAQQLMFAFNSTLFGDLDSSGLFYMKPKSVFPLNNPQRPEDLRPDDSGQGFALPDWAGAPVNASHLVFGYTAAQNGVLVLYGNVDDTRQANPQSAQLLEAVATPQRLPNDPQAWLAMSELGDKLGRHAYALTIAEAAVKRSAPLAAALNVHAGEVTNQAVAETFGMKCVTI